MLTMKEIVDMARGDREYQRLAADLGVHKATVSKWVQGIGVPDPEQIPELARLAGLSVAAVAIAALATRDRRRVRSSAWTQAWEQLARAGLASNMHYAISAEGHRRRRQSLTRLSGRVKHYQPALQVWRRGTLLRAWRLLRGYSTSSRTVSAAPSLPTLAWAPA